MPVLPINRAGQYGIVRDVAAHTLPLNAWSAGSNMRFIDGAAEKIKGHQQQFGVPSVLPYSLLPVPTAVAGVFFWMYMGLTKVYVVDQASLHTNITRQTTGVDVDYSASAVERWNGGMLSGIPIINNGVDVPQMWNPPTTGTKLAALSNWPSGYLCRTIRPFRRFLVAHDITKAGVRYPRLTLWSHPIADAGTVPSTWDITDETKDAGEFEWAETGDAVVDSLPMRDMLVVYKENGVYGMQHVGGVFVFRQFGIFEGLGILMPGWAISISRNEHAVFTGDDLVIHNGVQHNSVLEGRWRRWLRANLEAGSFKRSFLALNRGQSEIWLCFPATGATLPNKALIYNMLTQSITVRDLPGVSHGMYSINRDLAQRRLLLADPTNTRLHYMDESTQFNGSNITATLERTDIGVPLNTGEPPDLTTEKFIRRLWPRITGTAAGVVNVYTAMTNVAGETPSYGAATAFTIGTTEYIEVNKTGKFLNLKFESTTDIEWALHGYEVDVEKAGEESS